MVLNKDKQTKIFQLLVKYTENKRKPKEETDET